MTKTHDTDVRICPERDAECPHGINCPRAKDRYSCHPDQSLPIQGEPMAWYSEDSQGGKQVQIDCPTKGYPEHIKVQPLYTHPVPVTGVTISPEDAEIILQDMKETALAWKANGHDILYVRFKGICERLEAALSQTKEGLDPATDPRD